MLCRAFALTLSLTLSAAAEPVALILAQGDYDSLRDLDDPANDAAAMAALLETLGFEVTLEVDRDLRRMRRALANFAEDAAGAELAVVYYTGHGVEIGGQNYLLPSDADPSAPEALATSAVPLNELVATLGEIVPAALLLVDACRNDPFAGTPMEAMGRGAVALSGAEAARVSPSLARIGLADGLVYGFAAAPGSVAYEGAGDLSPFAEALVRHLATPGLELRTALTLVTQDVYDRTRGKQLPYVESALPGFIFVGGQPADLSERETLLLAMSGLSGDVRADVDTLAAQRGMPLAPLYAALLSLPPGTSRDDQTKALTEAADAYAAFQASLLALSEADPKVADLRAAAAADLDLGQFQAAQDKFDQAIAVDEAARAAVGAVYVARTVSQAETLILAADAARARLDHAAAIDALSRATALLAQVADIGLTVEGEAAYALALWNLGELHQLVGNTPAAMAAFRNWNALALARSTANPGDAGLLRDLSVSHNKIGEVLLDQGDLPGAERAYRAGLVLSEQLAAQNAGDSDLQRDLSISHERIGDILRSLGDLPGAEAAYAASYAIRSALVDLDPGNDHWQRDLSFALIKVAVILRDMGNLPEAEAAYRRSADIAQALVAKDPSNAQWRNDLVVSRNNIGDILLRQDDLPGAEASYRDGLAIQEQLAASDPANAEWQRDLSVGYERLGDVLVQAEDYAGAEAAYRRSIAIAQALAATDPANALWQSDLAISHQRIGDAMRWQGDLQGAEAAYRAGLAILLALTVRDPSNAKWQLDLSSNHDRIGDILRDNGDAQGAQAAYRESLAIRQALAGSGGGSVQAELALAVSHYKLALVSPDPRADLQAALDVLLRLQEQGRLPPANQGWIDLVQGDLASLSR